MTRNNRIVAKWGEINIVEPKTGIDYTLEYEVGGYASPLKLPYGMSLVKVFRGGKLVSFGLSRCSDKDEYNLQKGLKLALADALLRSPLFDDKYLRTTIWHKVNFFNTVDLYEYEIL